MPVETVATADGDPPFGRSAWESVGGSVCGDAHVVFLSQTPGV